MGKKNSKFGDFTSKKRRKCDLGEAHRGFHYADNVLLLKVKKKRKKSKGRRNRQQVVGTKLKEKMKNMEKGKI